MSDKLTNQAAGRLLREMQGACYTAARTMLPADSARATSLVTGLLGQQDRWMGVDPQARERLDGVYNYVNSGCFALAALELQKAARTVEDNIPRTRS